MYYTQHIKTNFSLNGIISFPYLFQNAYKQNEHMKNITIKIILSITLCTTFALLVTVFFVLSNGKDIYTNEAMQKLFYFSQNSTNQFSKKFISQESVVKSVAAITQSIFTTSEYEHDRDVFINNYNTLSLTMKQIITENKNIKSLFFTFNPDTSKNDDEIWYIRDNNTVLFKDAKPLSRGWLLDNELNDYYYEAIKYGERWSGVEYELGLDISTITYSYAVYDTNKNLIGVAGVDIPIEDILNSVKKLNSDYINMAILTDSNLHYIIGNSSEKEYKKMMSETDLKKRLRQNGNNTLKYTFNNTDYHMAYSQLENDWYLLLCKSEKELLNPFHNIQIIISLLCAIIILSIFLYSLFFSRKQVDPIIEESNKKDIYIISQSRQAKLGEMLGNIAHQWKQPLNSINVNMANMKDDFYDNNMTKNGFEYYYSHIINTTAFMSSTVDDFVDFLKPAKENESFSISKEIQTALMFSQFNLKTNSVEIITQFEDTNVYGPKNEFAQAIFNVINNAKDAVLASKSDTRQIRITTKNLENYVEILIFNSGNHIPEEIREKIFEPYFTTKQKSGGSGLGLYITREIIESHMHGTINLINSIGGVTCRITIPKESSYVKFKGNENSLH